MSALEFFAGIAKRNELHRIEMMHGGWVSALLGKLKTEYIENWLLTQLDHSCVLNKYP